MLQNISLFFFHAFIGKHIIMFLNNTYNKIKNYIIYYIINIYLLIIIIIIIFLNKLKIYIIIFFI